METIYLALRVLLSLAVVLAAIWYAHRRLTKNGRMPRPAKTVTVVTKQSISAKASVVVMDVDGQRFLLGVTEQSVTVLNTSQAPAAEPAPGVSAVAGAHPMASVPAAVSAPAVASEPLVASAPAVTSTPAMARVSTSTGRAGAFARVLSELQSEPGNDFGHAPVAYLAEPREGTLDGSILSAATWKRTAAALRKAR